VSSVSSQGFDPEEFVEGQVSEIKRVIGDGRALIAVSGGVDSTTSAALTHRAIGESLLCVMLDDAFMRTGEPEQVAQLLSKPPLNLPVKVLDVQKRFLRALRGLRDAEEKRKAFREAFYKTLGEAAKREGCRFLVQGTIRADVVETEGGVKTQHNVLAQIGISPAQRYGFQVVEPLVSLYKPQVRQVARWLGVPEEVSERQPFPGPGLSVRVVGEVTVEKLGVLKRATAVAEGELAKHRPEQYFAAIIDDVERPRHPSLTPIREATARLLNVPSRRVSVRVLRDRATGMRAGARHYGEIAAVTAQSDGRVHQPPVKNLVSLQREIITQNPSITRVLYGIQPERAAAPREKKVVVRERPYLIALRAVRTTDFMTAEVAEIPWTTLNEAAEKILESCPAVSGVYYDVTPKPPATIEME